MAKCDDVSVVFLLELLAAFDKLRAGIAAMRDGSTEVRKPQAKTDKEDLPHRIWADRFRTCEGRRHDLCQC